MRCRLLLTILLVACVFPIAAQHGIYLSAQDYYHNQLSYSLQSGKRYRLRLHDGFYRPFVTVVMKDTVARLAKDSIFGYRSAEGVDYRFSGKQQYEVLNRDSALTLYAYKMSVGTKPIRWVNTYYFSRGGGAVKAVTRHQIGLAFKDDSAFVERVYDSFETDAELIRYDVYHQRYKLTYLYWKR